MVSDAARQSGDELGTGGGSPYEVLRQTGANDYVRLDERITLTCDLERAVTTAELIVISISSQGLRGFMRRVMQFPVSDKAFVLLSLIHI